MFDVFVSYRHVDAARAHKLADVLRHAGLRVWIDKDSIEDFDSISNRIREVLAHSKVLLAWYSRSYSESRACQLELTAAYVASQRIGEPPRRRILVINPETTTDHIEPVDLRDALFVRPEAGNADFATLVPSIVKHVATLVNAFGDVTITSTQRWYGRRGVGSNRFVGRVPDMWRVHSALFQEDLPLVTPSARGGSLAQLVGLPGVGKSLAAEEYALRYGAAFPGGIFRLSAHDLEASAREGRASHVEVDRLDQIRSIALQLGIESSSGSMEEIDARLAHVLDARRETFLWIVDDVPAGLPMDYLLRWLAPGRYGKTLITTHSREYSSAGTIIEVDPLTTTEAYALLTSGKPISDRAQASAAERLAQKVGLTRLH